MAGLGIDVGPNHGLELLRGLAAAGLPDDMVHTLTDTSIPGWAHIVAAGGTFTWETWQPSDLIGDSMSHGWGSSALVAMQETLLGVTLRSPTDGTVRVAVAPPSAGLAAPRARCPRRRAGRGVLAARHGHLARPDGAGQRVGHVRLPGHQPSSVREGGAAAAAPGVAVFGGGRRRGARRGSGPSLHQRPEPGPSPTLATTCTPCPGAASAR